MQIVTEVIILISETRLRNGKTFENMYVYDNNIPMV